MANQVPFVSTATGPFQHSASDNKHQNTKNPSRLPDRPTPTPPFRPSFSPRQPRQNRHTPSESTNSSRTLSSVKRRKTPFHRVRHRTSQRQAIFFSSPINTHSHLSFLYEMSSDASSISVVGEQTSPADPHTAKLILSASPGSTVQYPRSCPAVCNPQSALTPPPSSKS